MSALASLPLSPPWLAAAAALLVFLATALALGALGRRREQRRAALAALASMRAGEFAHHVTSLLAQRGLRSDDRHRRLGHNGFDLRMTRGTARYLVQCKQDQTFPVNAETVGEFASMVRLHEAEGGILVTTSLADSAARRRASASAIELIAGKDLWRQLKPLLPLALTQDIAATAAARRRARLLTAAALAALAGAAVLAGAWMPGPPPTTAITAPQPVRESAEPVVVPAASAPAQADTAVPVAAAQPAPGGAASGSAGPVPGTTAADALPPPSPTVAGALPTQMPDPTLDDAELAARRARAERAVREVPGVARASWNTRSTMLLELQREGEELYPEPAIAAACAELVRFEELRYTRLQVQSADPRNEDEALVRWRQCR